MSVAVLSLLSLLLLLQVQRMHFHDFMLDIHCRLRHTKGEADPLKHVADDVAAGVKVGGMNPCMLVL
jgi:predicted ATPase